MQTLHVTRRIIVSFGMCPVSIDGDFCTKFGQIITTILALALLIQLDWFSLCYVVQHLKANDIESSTFAVMQVIAIFSTIASFISLIYHRKSVCRFFDRIQWIVDQCKNRMISCFEGKRIHIFFTFTDNTLSSALIYSQVNKFCEIFMVWVTLFMVASYVTSTLIPVAGGALYYYITDGHIDTRNLYLPLKLKYRRYNTL